MMMPDWGEDGQRRIAQARVLIVGAGGLGSPVALYLAAAGVGTIGLCDADTVSLTNLQRQILYSEVQLDMPKAPIAAARLRALNSQIEIKVYAERFEGLRATEIAQDFDIIVDCTDNYSTRYLIDSLGKPWVFGAISTFYGQASLFNANSRRRFIDLFPERDTLESIGASEGAVAGPTPGVVGSIQALEALKYIVGIASPLDGRLLSVDLLNYDFILLDI